MTSPGNTRNNHESATIREWLTDAGFDFHAGIIVHQETGREKGHGYRWALPVAASVMHDEILDKQFHDGHGSPDCPCFFARCGDWIYFPSQHDGATSLEKVNINPEYYLDCKNKTPYPGY